MSKNRVFTSLLPWSRSKVGVKVKGQGQDQRSVSRSRVKVNFLSFFFVPVSVIFPLVNFLQGINFIDK